MNARTLPRFAVDRSLRLVRFPIDATIARLSGGGETGAGPAAKLAVDRVDATVRSIAAAVLSDPVLREDARARDAAGSERERAMKLRDEAERQAERADDRLGDRRDQAEGQRERAEKHVASKVKRANATRDEKAKKAAETEKQRLASSRQAAARTEDAVEQRANQKRVVALDAKSESLADRQEALTAADEADRLAAAAARAKHERKNGQNQNDQARPR